MARQHGRRFRPLQGDQGAVVGARQGGAAAGGRLDQGEVAVLGAGVDHDDRACPGGSATAAGRPSGRRPCRHPRSAAGCSGAGRASGRRCRRRPGSRRWPRWRRGRLPDRRICSVRVRKAGPMCETSKTPACSRVHRCSFMMPVGILHRHVVAGEGDHAAAQSHMGAGQGRRLSRFGGGGQRGSTGGDASANILRAPAVPWA